MSWTIPVHLPHVMDGECKILVSLIAMVEDRRVLVYHSFFFLKRNHFWELQKLLGIKGNSFEVALSIMSNAWKPWYFCYYFLTEVIVEILNCCHCCCFLRSGSEDDGCNYFRWWNQDEIEERGTIVKDEGKDDTFVNSEERDGDRKMIREEICQDSSKID